MISSELYAGISKRKSTRKYIMISLPNKTLMNLKAYANSLKSLLANIKHEFSYLETKDVKNLLPIKAPHYICLYSEKKDNYLMNAGFLLQQIELYLSNNNLASCWLGMAKPTKEVPMLKNGLEFVIMLAFGASSELIHRKDVTEFKRKTLADISSIVDGEALLEPARLAPSASNFQPWFFSGNKDNIIVSRKKLNLLRAPLYGKMNQIDIGIAICHLTLSIREQGKEASFTFTEELAPEGYEFMAKIKVVKIEH